MDDTDGDDAAYEITKRTKRAQEFAYYVGETQRISGYISSAEKQRSFGLIGMSVGLLGFIGTIFHSVFLGSAPLMLLIVSGIFYFIAKSSLPDLYRQLENTKSLAATAKARL